MNCQDHLYRDMHPKQITRRWFFEQCGVGLGAIALAQSAGGCAAAPLRRSARAEAAALRAEGEARHLPVHGRRAEPSGAVRQQAAAREVRRHAAAGRAAEGLSRGVHQSELEAARPKFKFAKYGQSGAELSELLPHTGEIVDDIAIVKSMVTDAFNHAPGQFLMNTGTHAVRPAEHGRVGYCTGWVSETQDLPGFVVFSSGSKGPSGGNSCWGSGFLPTVYQGVQFRARRRSGAVSVESQRRR